MLADVLVASNVHQVHHGLRAHEQVLVEDLNLFTVPLAFTYRSIFAEHGLAANENVAFLLVLFLIFALNYAVQLIKKSLKEVCVFRSPGVLPHVNLRLELDAVDGLVLHLKFL